VVLGVGRFLTTWPALRKARGLRGVTTIEEIETLASD
jgi:hypothetical protein